MMSNISLFAALSSPERESLEFMFWDRSKFDEERPDSKSSEKVLLVGTET